MKGGILLLNGDFINDVDTKAKKFILTIGLKETISTTIYKTLKQLIFWRIIEMLACRIYTLNSTFKAKYLNY